MTDLSMQVAPARVGGVRPRVNLSWRGDFANLVLLSGLGIIVGLTSAAVRDGLNGPGGLVTAIGSMMAMTGTYLTLALLLLISRLPWLERAIGHDSMVKWHRKLAPYSIFLIIGHVAFTVIGYAQRAGVDVVTRFVALITGYPWMLPALVAFGLMVSLGISSYRRVRSKLKYETWATAHLYFYLAVILAFGHQIESGSLLANNPALKNAWIALYVVVGSAIVYGRFVKPLAFSLKHQLRVADVVEEAVGTVSIYITGKRLRDINARGGQFFQWRFLTRKWWWQAHPYSLSAAPNGSWLRITVKALGDQSAALASELRPGTRVFAEGPYGVFTADRRHSDSVVAFAAGVGVTPIRALLEELPSNARVSVIYRVLSADNAPLADEMKVIAAKHGWDVHVLDGPPAKHPLEWSYLRKYVPQLRKADVYICGPAGFTAGVEGLLKDLDIPADLIHHEAFAF